MEFNGHKFGKVWEVCKTLDMDIVADVHVHPAGYGQSPSDQENPMKLEAGHLAIILPDYAKGYQNPGEFGIYEYLGQRRWTNHTRLGQNFFRIR